jgi:hypothetical protein
MTALPLPTLELVNVPDSPRGSSHLAHETQQLQKNEENHPTSDAFDIVAVAPCDPRSFAYLSDEMLRPIPAPSHPASPYRNKADPIQPDACTAAFRSQGHSAQHLSGAGVDTMTRKSTGINRVGAHREDGVPGAAGTIAHLVIAQVLTDPEPRTFEVTALHERVRAACGGSNSSLNSRRIFVSAFSGVSKYLNRLSPTDCTFVASELDLGTCRPDLLWSLPDGRFFMDEIKTGRYLTAERVREQAARQFQAGALRFGHDFVGVRIVGTTTHSASLFMGPSNVLTPLATSGLSFPALRARTVGSAE